MIQRKVAPHELLMSKHLTEVSELEIGNVANEPGNRTRDLVTLQGSLAHNVQVKLNKQPHSKTCF